MPPVPIRWGRPYGHVTAPYELSYFYYYYAMMTVVSPVPDPKSRMGQRNKLKIGRREAHDMGDPWPHLEVKGHSLAFDVRNFGTTICHLSNTNKKGLLSFTKIRLIILHCNMSQKNNMQTRLCCKVVRHDCNILLLKWRTIVVTLKLLV